MGEGARTCVSVFFSPEKVGNEIGKKDKEDMGLQLIHMDFGVEEEEHENFGNSRIYIKIFHSYYCNAYFNKFEVGITNGRKWRVL